MARKLRLEYEGAVYHVISRGNRGESIFKSTEYHPLWISMGLARSEQGAGTLERRLKSELVRCRWPCG